VWSTLVFLKVGFLKPILFLVFLVVGLLAARTAMADQNGCAVLPSYNQFKAALIGARNQDNGGLNNDVWGSVVARDGRICLIANTGSALGSQWPGSRAIAAEKANTANGFSLTNRALSSANLYTSSQPGGFLFGIAASQPVNSEALFSGPVTAYGTADDPLIGQMVGGVIVVGGGLALYRANGDLVGALGISGDTSCADHNIGWRTRSALKLDYVPNGVSPDKNDNIVYDYHFGKSLSGYGHPTCGNNEGNIAKNLPKSETSGMRLEP
jgi:hypothetical protein